MKILYGIQGTGNGHLTRARVMAAELARQNIQTDYLVSGRPKNKLIDMAIFGDYRHARGLTFNYQNGKLDALKTLMRAAPIQLRKDIRALTLSEYDLVITDFEPVTAWSARLQKVPSIALSHQACFHFDVPTRGYGLSSRLIMNLFAPADRYIGLHWHSFGQAILPPIIDTRAHVSLTTKHAGAILVYLPFESVGSITDLLYEFSDYSFICYHPDIQRPSKQNNVSWRPFSKEAFAYDLKRAGGVLANSGFELPSESLHLGKKLLVKPLKGQFEQESNALTLRELKLAHVMMTLDKQALSAWLQAPAPDPIEYPRVAAALVQWLGEGAKQPLNEISEQLWREVSPRLTEVSPTPNLA